MSTFYNERWNAKKQQQSLEAKAWAQARGLPDLTGTEAQINWAETIRQEVMIKIDLYVDDLRTRATDGVLPNYPNMPTNKLAYYERGAKLFTRMTDAGWWIKTNQKMSVRDWWMQAVKQCIASDAKKAKEGTNA